MELDTAIDILKKTEESMSLVVKLGCSTPEMNKLVEALDVVINHVEKICDENAELKSTLVEYTRRIRSFSSLCSTVLEKCN